MKMIHIRIVSNPCDLDLCLAIRKQVFVDEQQVPLEEEIDGLDPICEQYLLSYKQIPVGTARVRYLHEYAKIERVAILKDYRGLKLGNVLMNFIVTNLKEVSATNKAKLGAQTYAIAFYEKLGFKICSEEYMDCGIPHKDMQLSW